MAKKPLTKEQELEQTKARMAQAEANAVAATAKQEQIKKNVNDVVKSKAAKAASDPELQKKFKDDKSSGAVDSKQSPADSPAKSPAESELETARDKRREQEFEADYANKMKVELQNKANATYDRSKEPEKPATEMKTTIDHDLAEERMKAKELENEQQWRKQAEIEKAEKSKTASAIGNAVNKVKQAAGYTAPNKVDSGVTVKESSNHGHKSDRDINTQLEQSRARVKELEMQKKAMNKVDKAIEGKPPYEQLKTLEAMKIAARAEAAKMAEKIAQLEKEIAAEKAAGKENNKENEAAVEAGNQANQNEVEHEEVSREAEKTGEKGAETDHAREVQASSGKGPENEQSEEASKASNLDKGADDDLMDAFAEEYKQVQAKNAASKSNDGPDFEP